RAPASAHQRFVAKPVLEQRVEEQAEPRQERTAATESQAARAYAEAAPRLPALLLPAAQAASLAAVGRAERLVRPARAARAGGAAPACAPCPSRALAEVFRRASGALLTRPPHPYARSAPERPADPVRGCSAGF